VKAYLATLCASQWKIVRFSPCRVLSLVTERKVRVISQLRLGIERICMIVNIPSTKSLVSKRFRMLDSKELPQKA
jgi:hypothetical protein